MSLLYIGQQITIFGGYLMIIAGIFGNIMNIIIFTTVRTYRTNPGTFYFLSASINNLIYIIENLPFRILSVGYNIDFTIESTFWCKFRNYQYVMLGPISYTCICLATIDQYFVSSLNPHIRHMSNIKWSHRILIIIIIIWCLHAIPVFLYVNNVPPNSICINANAIYRVYMTIFGVVFLCAIPVGISLIFGYLTYQNIQQTKTLVEQHADRQIIRMTFVQILLMIIADVPYTVFSIYLSITNQRLKSYDQQVNEYVIMQFAMLISYICFVANFYMFWISSSRFRQTAKKKLFCWKKESIVFPSHT
ncbi:unnamed protein product [Adineta ricciae]|uniref:G-protein coupled receptors family 1 profile domain-containing protein n=1 Tax=Adineta ricciae TaxID=249248 RepID=A0A816DXC2_ADIRI|nr:unnamed protein product [Adineta ricciae]